MKKVQKSETAPEEQLERNPAVETNTETQTEELNSELVDSPEEVAETKSDEIGGGGIKNPPKDEEEEDSIVSPEILEESVDINDGAEGNAGQDSLNDIPVDFEDVGNNSVNEKEAIYVDADIKLQNILNNFNTIQENDISFTKNEDLSVAITYVSEALKAVEKLRK